MNHILEYDTLLQDLESMGYEPLIGYGWCGRMKWGNEWIPTFFITKGKDEKECVGSLQDLMRSLGFPWGFNTSKYSDMNEILEALFGRGVIDDMGRYGPYKAKKDVPRLLVLKDPYQLNLLHISDLLRENFHITEENVKEFGIPTPFISK